MMTRRPESGLLLAVIVPLALVGCVVSLFIAFYVVRPRFILHDYRAFLGRHAVGSAVEDIPRDPFVGSATMVHVDGKFLADAGWRSALEAALVGARAGEVDLMWTHTPPFGRVVAKFRFESGHIVDVRTVDLD